jgi:phosphoserine phosphatase RsbU/P
MFTILVVDDAPMNIALVERTLAKEGYRVLTAADGPQGRQLAAEHQPDLILLDIMMPGENGFTVIQWLKSQSRTAAIPVIFLTAQDDIAAKVTGFDLGAVDYIIKPFQPLELCARVRLHLQLSLATHALLAQQAAKLSQLREAQTALLTTPEELPEAQFGAYYATLQEAGGDFYDVVQISTDIYGYFVADVAGHDIRTSFLTSALKVLLKQNSAPIYNPLDTMRMLNHVLCELLPCGKYLTACYAKLNRRTRTLSVVSAGHPPVLYVPRVGEARYLDISGDVLGVFPDVSHQQQDLKVAPGDRFFLYSDGLIERPSRRQAWTKGLTDLRAACDQVQGTAITAAATHLARLMQDNLSASEDDVVVLSVEV